MKKNIIIAIVMVFLHSSTNVYAGKAWPYVVGGLAGILTLNAIHDSHQRDQEVHHYYHDTQAEYRSRVAPSVRTERVWYPEGYDVDGNYHSGYYGYREAIE